MSFIVCARKGIKVDTKQRVIFCAAGKDITNIVQVKRIKEAFHFNIQIVIQ